MRRQLGALLACPHDPRIDLQIIGNDGEDGDIQDGELICPQCGAHFPIRNGIARLRAGGAALASQQEQVESFDVSYRGARYRQLDPSQMPEADAMRAAAGPCAGEWVLDAGCGYGQRMPKLPKAKGVIALDFSWTGLNEFPIGQFPANLQRIEADATSLPFPNCCFDTVLCGQVLPHIREEVLRERLISEIARVSKPSGRILISTLHFNFRFKLLGLAKEGTNEENAWFRRDTLDEFRAILAPSVQVERMWGLWTYLPHTYPMVIRLGCCIVYWDRIWRERGLSLKYGKSLLAICRPKPATTHETSA